MKRLALITILLSLSISCGGESPEERFTNKLAEARAYKEKDELESAQISYKAALQAKPDSSAANFELAEILLEQAKFPQAVSHLNSAINYDPANKEARIKLAGLLIAAKENEQAEGHVQKLLKSDPEDFDVKFLNANLLRARRKFDKSKEILDALKSERPDEASVYAMLGAIALEQSDIDQAEAEFSAALKKNPENPVVRLALSDIYTVQRRNEEAKELLSGLVEDTPENAGLRSYYSDFLLSKGQTSEALKNFELALEQDPAQHTARERLFEMYLNRNEIDKARTIALEVKEKLPQDPISEYFEGRVFELEGKGEEALEKYISVIRQRPQFSPPFGRAGLIEVELGQTRQGIEHLTQAIALNPGNVPALIGLAQVQFKEGKIGAAKENVITVLRKYPNQLGATIQLGDILLVEGNLKDAREIYQRLVEAYPDTPTGYYKLAILEEKAGNNKKSLENYKKVLEFDRNILIPARRYSSLIAKGQGIDAAISAVEAVRNESKKNKADYEVMLALLEIRKGKGSDESIVKARALLESALEKDPDTPGVYFALGQLDRIGGNLEDAVKNYNALLETRPGHIPTLMLLAQSYEQLEQFENAAATYDKVLEQNSRFGPAANNLAWLLAEKVEPNLDRALELAKIASEEMPKTASVVDTLGWVYTKRGQARIGLSKLEDAIDLHREETGGKDNAEILYHAAFAAKEAGNVKKQKEYYETALKLAAGNKRILNLLKKLEGA